MGVILHSRSNETAIAKAICFVVHVLNIFPLSTACVERLFFKDEVDKNTPEKPTVPSKAQSTSPISSESPKDGYNDNVYEYFVDEVKKETQTCA